MFPYSTTMPRPLPRSSSRGAPRTQTPGIVHFDDGGDTFGGAEFEDVDELGFGDGVAVEGHDFKAMAGEGELDVFGGACVEDVKEDALAFADADGIARAQAFAIDGEALVADFPAVGFGVGLEAGGGGSSGWSSSSAEVKKGSHSWVARKTS